MFAIIFSIIAIIAGIVIGNVIGRLRLYLRKDPPFAQIAAINSMSV